MELSYWEYKTWLSDIDFTIVGSGIVGLHCALHLGSRFPKAKILVLEKGILPQGASTKNAGFACFGSISELLADLNVHTGEEVCQLVRKRWEGIQQLRKSLGDKAIRFAPSGGHELFLLQQRDLYHRCLEHMDSLNRMLAPIFGQAPFVHTTNRYGFKGIQDQYISNPLEGQIDTGAMMAALTDKVQRTGTRILNGVTVKDFTIRNSSIQLNTDHFTFDTGRLLIATNGFASQWIQEDVTPARAQVLITRPIKNLAISGSFHLDEGFLYFRNVDGRILIGGGRNLDFQTEATDQLGQTSLIQHRLEQVLKEVILPEKSFQIDTRWSGIMGVGGSKKPIVKQLADRVYIGVRLGGMGVAIGSSVGRELAGLV